MAVLFTLTGTAGQAALVRDALCSNYNYQATLEDGSANPETSAQFAKRMLLTFVKENIKVYRAKEAEATRQQLLADAATQSNGIDIT